MVTSLLNTIILYSLNKIIYKSEKLFPGKIIFPQYILKFFLFDSIYFTKLWSHEDYLPWSSDVWQNFLRQFNGAEEILI